MTDQSDTAQAQPLATTRPPVAPLSASARTTEGVVDQIRSTFLSPEAEKVASSTRVLNSIHGYLQNVCGRKLDELTPHDTLKISMILKTLTEFEIENGRRR